MPSFKRNITVAAALTAIFSILTGCAAQEPTTTPVRAVTPTAIPATASAKVTTPTPTQPTATPLPPKGQEPRYGGTFTLSMYTEARSFDPHQEISFTTLSVVAPSTNNLIKFDPVAREYKVVPDLAKSWEISKDGTVYTFHLHEGVKYHDGKDFTSEDVKFNIERIAWPRAGALTVVQPLLSSLKKVEAPDRNTVVLTLEYPLAPFLDCLAEGHMRMLPKHVVEPLGSSPLSRPEHVIGTGPFKLKAFRRGIGFELVKNPEYFLKGLPYLDTVKYYTMPDATARFAALRTGLILSDQKSPGITPPQIEWIRQHPEAGITFEYSVPRSLRTIFMNTTAKPFSDLRVRKAVHLAIDREKVLALSAGGLGEVGSILSHRQYFSMPKEELLKLPGFRYPKDADVAEARRLMAEAGYPEGFEVDLYARRSEAYQSLAVAVAGELRTLGIRATVRLLDTAELYTTLESSRFGIAAHGRSPLLMDPLSIIGESFLTGAKENYGRASNPRVDELFREQLRTTDRAKRREINLEIERILMTETLAAIPLYWEIRAIPFSQKVKNWPGMAFSYEGQSMETVWLAK